MCDWENTSQSNQHMHLLSGHRFSDITADPSAYHCVFFGGSFCTVFNEPNRKDKKNTNKKYLPAVLLSVYVLCFLSKKRILCVCFSLRLLHRGRPLDHSSVAQQCDCILLSVCVYLCVCGDTKVCDDGRCAVRCLYNVSVREFVTITFLNLLLQCTVCQ